MIAMMKRKVFWVARRAASALIFAVLLSGASQSLALPVLCAPETCTTWSSGEDANGHSYAFVHLTSDFTWTAASALAQASIALPDGSIGYLATINSAEEQAFILNSVLPALSYLGTNPSQVWIGGQQDPGQSPTEAWKWIVSSEITPEAWSYENWMQGQPDDLGGIDERFLTMWVHNYQDGTDRRGSWNDEQDLARARIVGMLVEWSLPNVPEPGASSLVALGIGLLALRRRRTCCAESAKS